jgi:hypothetical protein
MSHVNVYINLKNLSSQEHLSGAQAQNCPRRGDKKVNLSDPYKSEAPKHNFTRQEFGSAYMKIIAETFS